MQIIKDFIAKGRVNRPGASNSCRYITVHETANTSRGANAKSHASYVKSLRERTSWHYTVDESSVYQHLPDGEKSYHTSDAQANENSIAVELCVNADGDFEKTKANAAYLVRELMQKHGIPLENLRTHHDWTGKNCPQKLLESGWKEFVMLCGGEDKKQDTGPKSISVSSLRDMGYTSISL